MTPQPPTLTAEMGARPARPAEARARFMTAIIAALSLHAGLALAWLGAGITPFGADGARLDAVAVTLVDGQALESLKPVLVPALAGQDAPLAATGGDAVEIRAAVPADNTRDVVEPPRADDPAVMIIAELPSPRLPLELPTFDPPQPMQTAAATSGGATSRAAAVAPMSDATAGAAPGVVDAYRSRLTAALSRTQPQSRGTAGTVRVAFTVGPDGALDAVTVSASSGHAALDSLALAAVRRARLPAPGAAMTESQRTFSMRYVFK